MIPEENWERGGAPPIFLQGYDSNAFPALCVQDFDSKRIAGSGPKQQPRVWPTGRSRPKPQGCDSQWSAANGRRSGSELRVCQELGPRIRRRAKRSAETAHLRTRDASGRTSSMFYFTARVNSGTLKVDQFEIESLLTRSRVSQGGPYISNHQNSESRLPLNLKVTGTLKSTSHKDTNSEDPSLRIVVRDDEPCWMAISNGLIAAIHKNGCRAEGRGATFQPFRPG